MKSLYLLLDRHKQGAHLTSTGAVPDGARRRGDTAAAPPAAHMRTCPLATTSDHGHGRGHGHAAARQASQMPFHYHHSPSGFRPPTPSGSLHRLDLCTCRTMHRTRARARRRPPFPFPFPPPRPSVQPLHQEGALLCAVDHLRDVVRRVRSRRRRRRLVLGMVGVHPLGRGVPSSVVEQLEDTRGGLLDAAQGHVEDRPLGVRVVQLPSPLQLRVDFLGEGGGGGGAGGGAGGV